MSRIWMTISQLALVTVTLSALSPQALSEWHGRTAALRISRRFLPNTQNSAQVLGAALRVGRQVARRVLVFGGLAVFAWGGVEFAPSFPMAPMIVGVLIGGSLSSAAFVRRREKIESALRQHDFASAGSNHDSTWSRSKRIAGAIAPEAQKTYDDQQGLLPSYQNFGKEVIARATEGMMPLVLDASLRLEGGDILGAAQRLAFLAETAARTHVEVPPSAFGHLGALLIPSQPHDSAVWAELKTAVLAHLGAVPDVDVQIHAGRIIDRILDE